MSRVTIIISVLIFIVLVFIGLWYWLFFEKGTTPIPTPTAPVSSNGFTPLNPSSPNQTPTTPTSTSTPTQSTSTLVVDTTVPAKVRRIYATPVASGLLASSTSSTSLVYFADRGNGHTYIADIDGDRPEKISNTTILRVYESLWDRAAKNVILRYIREGSGIVTSISSPLGTEIKARPLSNNISSMAVSPKGDRIFTLENGVGYISKIDGSAKTEVFNSPLSGWVVTWPEENTITLTTNASNKSPGYLYFLNATNKNIVKVLGPINGLTTNTSRDAKKVFYSQYVAGKTETKVFSLTEGSIQDTYLVTLPEKCTWSNLKKSSIYCAVPNQPLANLPDAWYKGTVLGNDQIWHLDTVSNSVNKVANLLEETGSTIDAFSLTLDQAELGLFFVNKYDLSLWAIDLTD